MEAARRAGQMTTLLSNELLHGVERLRIQSSKRFTDRRHGEHLAARGGSSTEFADYRDYTAGDDMRHVDWNIFARLHRPYLKLYRMEEEVNLVVLIDGSTSMQAEDKFNRAREIAAAFGVMGLFGGMRVSAYCFNDATAGVQMLKPIRGRGSRPKLFHYLEGLTSGGNLPLDQGIDDALKRHRGRGVVVVLSDFLTFGDMQRAFNALSGSGLEVFSLQIFGRSELEPDLAGDHRLIDCETDDTLDISSAGDLLQIYHEYREALQRDVEALSKQRGGRYACVSSEAPADWIVLDLLRRRGWVR
jgi:uncharacterized protein (DUF58 family)